VDTHFEIFLNFGVLALAIKLCCYSL